MGTLKTLGISYNIVGFFAFSICAYIEYQFFTAVTQNPGFAFTITTVLETGKVLTILVNRYIIIHDPKNITPFMGVLMWTAKVLLVIVSLICSIGFISSGLDRPNLESVKSKDKDRAERLYSEKYNNLQKQKKSTLAKIGDIKEIYRTRLEKSSEYYEPRIKKEERLRDLEFNRKINGVRKGERYREHDRKIKELSREYKNEKDQLLSDESTEINSFLAKTNAKYERKLDGLENTHEDQLNQIEKSTYQADERVKNKIVNAFLTTVREGLNVDMKYLRFSILFSILVSFTLEAMIYLIFNNIAIFYTNTINAKDDAGETSEEEPKEFLHKETVVQGGDNGPY